MYPMPVASPIAIAVKIAAISRAPPGTERKRTSETPELMLPHPHAHERAFVLVPWLDIERRATLPQGRVDDLVATMDTSVVRKLTDVRIEKP